VINPALLNAETHTHTHTQMLTNSMLPLNALSKIKMPCDKSDSAQCRNARSHAHTHTHTHTQMLSNSMLPLNFNSSYLILISYAIP